MDYSNIIDRICVTCKNELPISSFRLCLKRGKPYYRTDCLKCEERKEGERRMAKKPITELQGEKWVTLYENKYLLSNFGRIKIIRKRVVMLSRPSINSVGYKMVSFKINGEVIIKSLHRLLAINFIPNPHNYPTVNHINGIKTDNRLENLEWCSYAYNNEHARRTGLNKGSRGETSSNAILSNKQVIEIFNSKHSRTSLSLLYKVSKDCIDDIRNGVNWGWLTGKQYTPNKRTPIEYDGKKMLQSEWARYFKVTNATLIERIGKGQSFEHIFNYYKLKNAV